MSKANSFGEPKGHIFTDVATPESYQTFHIQGLGSQTSNETIWREQSSHITAPWDGSTIWPGDNWFRWYQPYHTQFIYVPDPSLKADLAKLQEQVEKLQKLLTDGQSPTGERTDERQQAALGLLDLLAATTDATQRQQIAKAIRALLK